MLHIVDLPVRWHQLDARLVPKLSIDVLWALGQAPHHETTAVFVHERDLAPSATIKAWVKDYTFKGIRLFSRVQLTEYQFRVDRQFLGVCFLFNCEMDAMYFRLRWYANG